jgi:WD40 repeat protein
MEKLNFIKNNITFENIKTIKEHKNTINSISIFPSGKLISISVDKTIIIYDNNLNIIQKIRKAHNNSIEGLSIKDDNNFITSSTDNNIKNWRKIGNKFVLNSIIENAHKDLIYSIQYCKNGNIISYSKDKTIKIWESINNNKFQNIITILLSENIHSILLLEFKNLIFTLSDKGTKLWNYNNFELIKNIEEIKSIEKNAIAAIDDDKIIFGGGTDNIMKIVSIKEKKILKEIDNKFQCYGICILRNKGYFLIGGYSRDINIYRNDNYVCILHYEHAHDGYISGFNLLIDNKILSYSFDKTIKVWELI